MDYRSWVYNHGNKKWKILIIDDDEEDFFLAKEMLKEAKGLRFDVHWADTYQAGRQELQADHYDAVLVDYDLGVHSGIELIREASERGYASPLILYTGRGSYEVDVEAMQAGATMYLTKGEVSPLLLERSIRYAIELKMKERTLRESEAHLRESEAHLRANEAHLRESEARLRESEAKVRASEAKLRAVFQSLIEGVVLLNPQGEVEVVNDAVQRIYGQSLDELFNPALDPRPRIIRPDGSLFPVDELPAIVALRTGKAVRDVELGVPTRDGRISWRLVNAQPVYNDQGALIGAVASFFDITERKKAEDQVKQALTQAEEGRRTLEALMEYIPEGITIADAPNATIRMVSRYGQEILGGEFTRMTADQVNREWKVFDSDGVTPLPTEQLPLVRAIQKGEVIRNQDIVEINAQGELVYLSCNAGPIRDAAGKITGGIIAWREISERKQAEERLQQINNELMASEDLLTRLVQSAPVGIAFLSGPQHVYTLVNQEYCQYARGKGDLIGHTVAEKWPEIAETVIPQLDRVFQTGEPFSIENASLTIIRSRMPEDRYFSYSFIPIYKADGQVEGVMILAVDTTDTVRAQLAAEAQSSRLETVLQALPVGVWITDANGRILEKNEQADRIWAGKAPMVISADQYREYQSWDARSGKKLEIEEYPLAIVLRTGQPVEPTEHRIRRFDGSEGYVLVSATPILNKEGQLVGAVAINLDITARKRAELTLRLSEERFARAFDANPAAQVVSRQSDGQILNINEGFERLFGYRREEVIGRSSIELNMFANNADRDAAIRQIRAENRLRDFELNIRTRAGEVRQASISAEVIQIDHEPLMLTVIQDITHRKQVEEALRESEEAFRKLADAMPQLVWTARADGTVDYYNQRHKEYEGIAQNEKGEWEWGPVLHPDDLQQTMDAWSRAVATGETYQVEHRVRMADKSYCWHLSRGIPIKDAQGSILRWYGTATNIHLQKETEEKLRQSNKELEQFAFVASHDLQEPLRKIIMFGNSLQNYMGKTLDEDAGEYLHRMQSAAERLHAMINGLLQLSRTNTRALDYTAVNLRQLVDEVVSDLDVSIRSSEGNVVIGDLPEIKADEMQMRQLFQNLISNAIKFQKPDIPPVVKISAVLSSAEDAREVEIRVEDNGIGFDQKYEARVFQPFQRLHGKADYEGTGLGLAICQTIVERHRGTIRVESVPGVGTKFTIRLPQNPHPPTPSPKSL